MTGLKERRVSDEELKKRLQRGEQRRQATRRKLLDAAFELFALHGREAPSVDDVVAHAKVARGSFYNHFVSREELFDAVANDVGSAVQLAILPRMADVADPAERICGSFRIFLRLLTADAKRGLVLLRTFSTTNHIDNASAQFFETALREGMATGRLKALDHMVGVDAVVGMSVAAIRRILLEGAPRTYIDDIAFAVMRLLGLDEAEAHRIAYSPMPDQIDFPE